MSPTPQEILHVFAGSFSSREEACCYTEQQWEPEPGDDVSDEAYSAWEDRNPSWRLREDLSIGLDPDFIETIVGEGRFEYLSGYLVNKGTLDSIRATAGDANVLVLLFPEALRDPEARLSSTPKLKYCGSFQFRWR